MHSEIGGYFELELPQYGNIKFLHSEGALLNSGKHALEYILSNIKCIKKIWISYYTCDTVLIPINKLGIEYGFYRLRDTLEIDTDSFVIGDGEYILYHNYFGIKDKYIQSLHKKYGDALIIDYAQSYCSPYISGTKAFFSARKSFGVPDGGVAFPNIGDDLYEQDYSNDRCSHLLKRYERSASEGYDDFKKNNILLREMPILKMSKLTQRILNGVNFESVSKIRTKNFNYLNKNLSHLNGIGHLCGSLDADSVPAFYPFYSNMNGLRQHLISKNIFVALYWPNVLAWLNFDTESVEYNMAKYVIPLPIDQRYGYDEMNYIICNILNYNE